MDNKPSNHIVITNCDYIAQHDDELSFSDGDEIIVLNEDPNGRWKGRLKKNNKIGLFSIDRIHIDSIDINRVCFCRKSLKRDHTTLTQWTCHCCNQIITNENDFYHCKQAEQCAYVQMGNRYVYQVCSQCFNTQNENVSDNTPYNDFVLIKIRAMMKRMNESAMQCSSSEDLEAYVFRVYRGLYIDWIKKLSDTDFAASKQHKLVLEEFDAFYGALLSNLSVDTIKPLHKMVTANTDYKGTIDHELTFDKNDKIMILFEDDNGWMVGRLESGVQGMVYIDHIYIDNVNQMCYCMKPLKKTAAKNRCECCCKEYPQEDVSFYGCDAGDECTYYQISKRWYYVCSVCFHSKREDLGHNEHKENEDNGRIFRLQKVKATLNIMKERLNDETRKAKHLDSIRWFMYTCFIRKLNDDQLEEEFNAFYEEQLALHAKEIDLKELELKEDMMPSDKQSTNIRLKRIAMEWHSLMTENAAKEAEFEDTCSGDLTDCSVRKRVQFVMGLFKKYFLFKYVYKKKTHLDIEFVDVFLHSLGDYDGIQLTNDAHHYGLYHLNDDALRDCDIAEKEEYDAYVCCKALLQKARDAKLAANESDLFSVYAKQIHGKEFNIIEIASNLHQLINHQTHGNAQPLEYNPKVRALTWWKKRDTAEYNKFMNEIIEEKENKSQAKQTGRASMDKMYENLMKHGASDTQCADLWHEINDCEYDSESIVMDVMDKDDVFNEYKQSNLYRSALNKNKYFMKIIKKHFGQKTNDDDRINRFDLGQYTLYHWTYFKDFSNYIPQPKYASLKEETLNNNIHHITLQTFNRFVNKAFIHAYSSKGRRLKAMDRSADNNIYEIPPHLPMSVSHLLVIMFYCNLNDLQRLYKKYGCRPLYVGEDLDSLKARNQEIAHWYRLLFEAIYFYGSQVTTNDVYYTGINVRVCFDTFAPVFRCPLSTTTREHVAHGFSKGIGVIVKIVCFPGSMDMCFNVEWLSNYQNESERLFFYAYRVRIEDITYFDKSDVYSNVHYVSAFKLWSSLFGGEFFNIHLRGKQRKETQRILTALIQNYNQNNGIKSANDTQNNWTIDVYIQRVFYHLIHQLSSKQSTNYIIPSEFDLLNESLKRELLSFDTKESNGMSLSPLLRSVIGDSLIVDLREFIWVLSKEQIEDLKDGEKDIDVMSEQYYDKSWNGSNVTFQMGIRNESSNEYTGFMLKISECSTALNGTFSIAINELNWMVNRWPFYNLSQGQAETLQFFEDKLLRDAQSLTLRLAIRFMR
eukprot:185793_1